MKGYVGKGGWGRGEGMWVVGVGIGCVGKRGGVGCEGMWVVGGGRRVK